MRTLKSTRWLALIAITLPLVLVSLLLAGIQHAAAQVTPQDDPPTSTWTAKPLAGQPEFVPDRLIVQFSSGVQPSAPASGKIQTGRASLDALLSQHGVQSLQPLFVRTSQPELTGIHLLSLPRGSDVLKAVEAFSQDANVAWAEPDYLARSASIPAAPLALTPNDPLLPDQWGLDAIQAEDAWDTVTGTQTVVIAVLDSGIDKTHVDLAGKLWVNPGEIAGNSLDDDNNGYVDDVYGWDFVNNDNDPSDDNGHGTQAAGIAAAIANNSQGIAGVCWNCKIMPVKVMQFSGVANYSDITKGVWYAAQKGAKVINLSLGGYGNSSALQAAIQAAVNTYGAVVVAGAGNDNLNAAFYPAAYPETLAVAGTTITDSKAYLSNYGSWVDVSAPAINITTTFLGGDWGPVNGTSFAAPFASGLAGLLISQHPDWTPEMVKTHLERTADDIDVLNPAYQGLLGSGRLNAARAVGIEPHPILTLVASQVNGDAQGRPTQGEAASLVVTLGNDWFDASSVTGTLSTNDSHITLGQEAAAFGDVLAGGTASNSAPFTFTVDVAAGYNYPIPFDLAIWADGGTYSVTFPLTLTTRSANESVFGTIMTNTLWTNDKTYLVESNLAVMDGVTLTIQPGTDILFTGNYELRVGGTLIADGTQAQPIRIRHQTGGSWGRLYYYDIAVDAQTDISGTYQSGNILRWVEIADASQGIYCEATTPHIARATLDEGGINCTPGATTLWLQDSTLVGNVTIGGGGQTLRNTISGGSLSLSGQATVLDNHISGGIETGSDSLVQGNTAGGTINAPGASIVKNNVVSGGGITAGNLALVWHNRLTGGSLSTGSSSSVMSNTLSGGGITNGAGSTVHRNNVNNPSGWGISSSGSVTITYNRVVGCGDGVSLSGGVMQNNLVANNTGLGLQINGNSSVISNTFTGNLGSAIKLSSATNLLIQGNNLEGNKGTYDIENRIPKASYETIMARYNWWGTTNSFAISQRIYDRYDGDLTVGQIVYAPTSSAPVQSAPAYVRSVSMDPDGLVGIEQATFEVEFSRPMDQGTLPGMSFYSHLQDTWTVYDQDNSGMPSNEVLDIAIDANGSAWFGTSYGGAAKFDGTTWAVYNTSNSGLPHDKVWDIAIDANGSAWFGTSSGGVAKFDGTTWTVYNTGNSGLPNNAIRGVAIDSSGAAWFGTEGGAAKFDGITWTVYNTSNSGLPSNCVYAIAIDANGSAWFGFVFGAAKFDGTTWTVYNTGNSGLPRDEVSDIALDANGSVWFGTWLGGAAKYDGTTWTVYNTGNSGLPNNTVVAIAFDSSGSAWFGTGGGGAAKFDGTTWIVYNTGNSGLPNNDVKSIAFDASGSAWFGTYNGGAAKLWSYPSYPVSANARWLDDTRYQASFEFNTLIPRDTYSLTVKGAVGLDDILITPNSSLTFTVDYAGAIGDTTPPHQPEVTACGASSPDTLSASWSAYDPDSLITMYSYAIGSSPGGVDIINYTNTSSASVLRSGLGLLAGHNYYVSVKARNEGGLWSDASTPPAVIAGSNTCTATTYHVFLPVVIR